ncbi:hypothetical protein SDC9_175124 [bioreactor metagenome]|uniref:Uncharacterized protein n=1 Tax=bioreactor metagenome TaxID=1076179 RepID=A0A645GND8_9ZZZZ
MGSEVARRSRRVGRIGLQDIADGQIVLERDVGVARPDLPGRILILDRRAGHGRTVDIPLAVCQGNLTIGKTVKGLEANETFTEGQGVSGVATIDAVEGQIPEIVARRAYRQVGIAHPARVGHHEEVRTQAPQA